MTQMKLLPYRIIIFNTHTRIVCFLFVCFFAKFGIWVPERFVASSEKFTHSFTQTVKFKVALCAAIFWKHWGREKKRSHSKSTKNATLPVRMGNLLSMNSISYTPREWSRQKNYIHGCQNRTHFIRRHPYAETSFQVPCTKYISHKATTHQSPSCVIPSVISTQNSVSHWEDGCKIDGWSILSCRTLINIINYVK